MTSSTNRTALVTGAGRGLGRAIAIGLAAKGIALGLVARSADELDEAADAVRTGGGRAVTVPADLQHRTGRDRAVGSITEQLGDVDILVNNAATVRPLGASDSLDIDEWMAALELNVLAAAALSFAVLPAMRARGWGRIVNVPTAAVSNPTGMVGGNAYVASKAALEAHTINLAAEIAGTGVTVNVYRPGTVDTAMQGWIRDQGSGHHRRHTPRPLRTQPPGRAPDHPRGLGAGPCCPDSPTTNPARSGTSPTSADRRLRCAASNLRGPAFPPSSPARSGWA